MSANSRRTIARAVIFAGLTALTQIGGLCYLLGLVVQRRGRFVGWVTALLVYVVLTVLVVPPLAALAGRVRLPCATDANAACKRPLLLPFSLSSPRLPGGFGGFDPAGNCSHRVRFRTAALPGRSAWLPQC